MDKFLKKLEKLLEKSNLDDETKNQILDLAKEEPEVEPTAEPSGEPEPPAEPTGNDPVVEPQGEPTPQEPAPSEVPPVVEPPAEPLPVEPTTPSVDTIELQTKVEELTKANEGLASRLEALESALKEANILTDTSAGAVGIDENKAPANNPIDDPMTAVLNEINRGHR